MLTLMTYSIVGSHWFLLNLPFLEGKCSCWELLWDCFGFSEGMTTISWNMHSTT